MAKFEEVLRAAVSEYLGTEVLELWLWEDGSAIGTYALKAAYLEERRGRRIPYQCDFLLVSEMSAKEIECCEPKRLVQYLDECEFKSWPPEERSR